MGKPVAGEVVVLPFPRTDLKAGKVRPALVLVSFPGDDLVLCQITSQSKSDGFSIALVPTDFSKGRLPLTSFIRPNRLFTVEQSVVLRSSGHVRREKLDETLAAVRGIFS